MAQSVKFISIDGELSLFYGGVCDRNDIEEHAQSYGVGTHFFETAWYSVGEGESGLDEFISESEIESMILDGLEVDDIIEKFEELGFCVDLIQSDNGEVEILSCDPEDYDCNYIDDDCGFDPYMGCYTYDC